MPRKAHSKDGAAARVVVDGNATLVDVDGPFDDGETEGGITAALIGPFETLERRLTNLSRNALSAQTSLSERGRSSRASFL